MWVKLSSTLILESNSNIHEFLFIELTRVAFVLFVADLVELEKFVIRLRQSLNSHCTIEATNHPPKPLVDILHINFLFILLILDL